MEMAAITSPGADHDVEETILTISRVKRSYSPWSSKIYTLRETPHKK
jgi:ABC-type cobalt transport system substrate-binding protein